LITGVWIYQNVLIPLNHEIIIETVNERISDGKVLKLSSKFGNESLTRGSVSFEELPNTSTPLNEDLVGNEIF